MSKELFEELDLTIAEIRKENQELKKQLDKYENPEDMTLFAMWCTEKVKDENKELKRQLEECYCNRTDCSSRIKNSKKYDSLVQAQEAQQKEFIKYLEDEIQSCEAVSDLLFNSNREMKVYKEILQKYKEITQTKSDKSV